MVKGIYALLASKALWVKVTGFIPIISSNYGLLLQIIKSKRLKQMSHLAWSLVFSMVITSSCCLVHSVLIGAWWLAVKDVLAFSCAVTLFLMKLSYDGMA